MNNFPTKFDFFLGYGWMGLGVLTAVPAFVGATTAPVITYALAACYVAFGIWKVWDCRRIQKSKEKHESD